jgi:hypothetical protein
MYGQITPFYDGEGTTNPVGHMISRTGFVILVGICLVIGIFPAGCTQQATHIQTPAPTPAVTKTTGAGMANPASVFCGQNGGTTRIMTNPDGSQYGMCTFSNGTTCEEWALFRGEGCKPGVNTTTIT